MASEISLKSFIDRQRELLKHEREAEVERTSLLLSNCSQRLLEQKGLALGGLGVVSVQIGLGGKSLIELERPSAFHTTTTFPPHTLRTGDLARIEEHVSPASSSGKKSGQKLPTAMQEDRKALEGVVYKEEAPPSSPLGLKLANSVTYDRMDKAIDQLEHLVLHNQSDHTAVLPRPSSGPNALHRVLLGISAPSKPPSNITPSIFFDQFLNKSQLTAVQFALRAPEVACIHGPPGTGKTRVLVEVIRQLVFSPLLHSLHGGPEIKERQNQVKPCKILVCGASNLAVDNLLERLSGPIPTPGPIPQSDGSSNTTESINTPTLSQHQFPPITLTRLGHPARVLSSLHTQTLDSQAQASDEAALVKDIKDELEDLMRTLSGSGSRGVSTNAKRGRGAKVEPFASSRGAGGTSERLGVKKGQRLRGEERRKAWDAVRDLRKEYRKREGGIVKSVLSRAQVVLATCHGAGSRQLYNCEFDVVIIDEATQALEAVCWIPVLKARKLILAGDPLQLGPTIISEGNKRHSNKKRGSKTTASRNLTKKTKNFDSQNDNAESESNSDTSASSTSVENLQADTISLDEGSQVTKQAGINPQALLRPPESLSTTMFDRLERMYNGKIKRMLDVQYRMNKKICAFPARTLYHSRLTSHLSNASRLLRDLPGVNQDTEYEDIVGEGSEVVFWDTAGAEFWERSGNDGETGVGKTSLDDGSLCNENEATIVKRWVERLMEAGVKTSDIAIITPYQAQSQVLSALLTDPDLEIGTADGMQGREREAVVISLVRSNPDGEVGFLKDKRRLNVAMTRAKRQLCVIGDSSTIRRGGGNYLKKWMSWLEAEADVRFAGDEL